MPKLRFKDEKGNDYPEWNENLFSNLFLKKPSSLTIKKVFSQKSSLNCYPVFTANQNIYFSNLFQTDIEGLSLLKDGAGAGRIQRIPKYSSVLGTMMILITSKIDHNFSFYLLSGINFDKYITGTTIPHIYFKDISKEKLQIPTKIIEQQKIGNTLSYIDELIENNEDEINKLENYKKGLMQKLFAVNKATWLRFKDEKGNDYPDWKNKEISEVTEYEQPSNFLVSEVKKNGKIPVLTPGKTFIKGYTDDLIGIYKDHPVILFDDFTCALQFVKFDFKIKSSAIKLIKARNNDIYFFFYLLLNKNFSSPEHKRNWISNIAKKKVEIPIILEQQKIGNTLSYLDELIDNNQQQKEQLDLYKKGLMQQLF